MITIDRVTPEEAEHNQETILKAYAQKMEQQDVLKIAMAIQGIALALPDHYLNRVKDYLNEIEKVVMKYSGGGK